MAAPPSLEDDLETLRQAVDNLPQAYLSGRRDGLVAKHLTPGISKGNDPKPVFPSIKKDAYAVFNLHWERVFQRLPGDPTNKFSDLVLYGRGSKGLILAHAWAAHYASIAKGGERDLIQLRVQSLLTLIEESFIHANSRKSVEKIGVSAKEIAAANKQAAAAKTKKRSRAAPKEPNKKAKTAATGENKDSSDSDSSSSSSSESEPETAANQASLKLTWPLTQYKSPVKSTKKRELIWKFPCRHCSKFRTTGRTEGVKEWAEETQKIKNTSNFIAHADDCPDRPSAQSFEAYQTARERARQGLPALPIISGPSPLEAERNMMGEFIQRGIENPAKVVTNASYRKHLVEAIVEDDHPFSMAEKGGTLRLLEHLVPRNVKARITHQVVRRDIDSLHSVLRTKLKTILKWVLREYVLDLIALDGDHSGKAVGKLVYKRLKKDKIAGNIMASGADNASSNGPLNRTISRKCAEHNADTASARNIQIGKINETLGVAPRLREIDLYEKNRKFPLSVREMELMEKEAKNEGKTTSVDSDLDSDAENDGSSSECSSDTEAEESEWEDDDDEDDGRRPRGFSHPVDKVHSVAVSHSTIRDSTQRARLFIRKKVAKENRHLVFIRSMKAFDAFVSELPNNLKGKPKAVATARKKKWEMSSGDWEFVEKLVAALQILKLVTLEFSKRILPMYKLMEVKLEKLATKHDDDLPTLARALRAGATMATKYISNALYGDYPLLAAVLHPAMRLAYFQGSQWDKAVAIRAKKLVLDTVEKYVKADSAGAAAAAATSSAAQVSAPPLTVFAMAMALDSTPSTESSEATPLSSAKDEVELYFGNISAVPKNFDDPLGWWKANAGTLKYVARVARDVLAVPGRTTADDRASMTAETISVDVVTKAWLKSGLGEGVNYTDFIKIHAK
ncbi:reverse transcriptase-RNase H-integrase [Favolaschia claudopus]|uniref:Reverse transcriptase-RNase H-integrase n=1 Tax=Favolaschia claudopus TaxID=2862362 RepID=A0AAW0CZ84_9AGAR